MLDPFLSAHQVAGHLFDIAGRLSPLSIRDQMIRAMLFIERAQAAELIRPSTPADPEGRRLVIVGAGACGMTAAMCATAYGIPVTVLERSDEMFRTQSQCATRWIDPHQYDWPTGHWDTDSFPLPVPAKNPLQMPLGWTAGFAQQVAGQWSRVVNIYQSFSPTLDIRFNVSSWHPAHIVGDGPLTVFYTQHHAAVGSLLRAGAVAIATGFGAERVEVQGSNFRGFGFWESDPFSHLYSGSLGPGFPKTPPKILISGSGDGALQDFLRIMTGVQSARELLKAVEISEDARNLLKDFDRYASHGNFWGDGARHDHAWHQYLDEQYRKVARDELTNAHVRDELSKRLDNRACELRVVHSCDHLTAYYGANRFLTLLIDEYLKAQRIHVLVPKTRLFDVHSAEYHHVCQGNAQDCYGQEHEVTCVQHDDCQEPDATGASITDTYNAIIIRHGIKFDQPAVLARDSPGRQILPYFFP
jgi:Pyridine nucleotide-disulphide oxidoreductase